MTNLFKRAACFGDIHYGMRNNAKYHNDDCDSFIDWFIEQAKEKNCETCIFLCDLHHNRNSLNISTMKYSLAGLRKLNDAFDNVYFLLGNHDLYYRESRALNSIEFIEDLPNIHLIRDSEVIGDVALVSWLVNDEWKAVPMMEAKYLFGHLELPKFKLNAMVEMPDHGGLNHGMFKHFDFVFSGHFHKRQVRDNVIYIGNPFPHNFSDAWDDDRGWMFLEWDKEPEFFPWDNAPSYKTIQLSDLLDNPEKYLLPKSNIRVSLDINITYEEASFIKDTFIDTYALRDLSMQQMRNTEHKDDSGIELHFETVDEIVISQLSQLDGSFNNNLLVDIYNSL